MSLQKEKPTEDEELVDDEEEDEEDDEEQHGYLECGAGIPPPDDDDDDDDDADETRALLQQPSQESHHPPPPRYQQPTNLTIQHAWQRFQHAPPTASRPPMPPPRLPPFNLPNGCLAPHANINVSPMTPFTPTQQPAPAAASRVAVAGYGKGRGKKKKSSGKKNNGGGGGGDDGDGGDRNSVSKKSTGKKKASDDPNFTSARFTQDEVTTLIDIIESVVPIGQILWEVVERDYNTLFPTRQRNMDNLRRQFNRQVKKKAPTGDPNMPEYVRRAKKVHEAILQKADAQILTNGEEDEADLVDLVGRNTADAHLAEMQALRQSRKSSDDANSEEEDDGDKKPPAKKKKQRSKSTTTEDSTSSILQAFLAAETARREAQERRDRKEEERDRKQQRKDDQQMQMMFGLVASAFQAFNSNNEGRGRAYRPANFGRSDDGSEEADDYTSLSSGEWERCKARWRRMNKRRRRRSSSKRPVDEVKVDSLGYKTGDSRSDTDSGNDSDDGDKKPAAK